jgi:hypothetical protein
MRLAQKAEHIYDLIRETDKQDNPPLYLSDMIDAVNSFNEEVQSFDQEAHEALNDYQVSLQNIYASYKNTAPPPRWVVLALFGAEDSNIYLF